MQFERRRTRRRPGLTPLIDVVFLLLFFFMLASSFGAEGTLPLRVAPVSAEQPAEEEASRSGGAAEELRVDLQGDGQVVLRGRVLAPGELREAVAAAMSGEQPAPVVRVVPAATTELQAIVTVLEEIARAGATDVALSEPSGRVSRPEAAR